MEYESSYGKLMIIPWLLVALSIGIIFFTVQDTGDFVRKGVTLSGGVSATATMQQGPGVDELQAALAQQHPQADFAVRTLSVDQGDGYIVEASNLAADEQEAADILEAYLRDNHQVTSLTVETTGPALGDAFFVQTILGVLLAFLWMGWVVYLYFGDKLSVKFLVAILALVCTTLVTSGVLSGTAGMLVLFSIVLANMILYLFISVPSGAVILAAASTILFTLAAINLLGVRLSTAGVAAFLMIIGYSVDTDILLSTRVLKAGATDQSVQDRLWGAFKTGITMQGTTTVAVLVAYLFATSEVITQIMLILLIGMVGDILFTWLQNAGIIYWYVNRMREKGVKVA